IHFAVEFQNGVRDGLESSTSSCDVTEDGPSRSAPELGPFRLRNPLSSASEEDGTGNGTRTRPAPGRAFAPWPNLARGCLANPSAMPSAWARWFPANQVLQSGS